MKRLREDNGVPVFLEFKTTPQGTLMADFGYGRSADRTDPIFASLLKVHRFKNFSVLDPQYRIFWSRIVESDGAKIVYDLLNAGWYIEQKSGRDERYIRSNVTTADCGTCVSAKTKCSGCHIKMCNACFLEHNCAT
jgi:hypothetical protein